MELALEEFTPQRTLLETTQKIIGEEMSQILLASIKGRVMICVLDTNFLLNDIQNLIRRGSNTWLMDAAQTGIVRLFASTTVRDEVREKLNNPKIIGKKLKIDPVVALQHWVTYYIPRITFLDPTGLPHLSPRVKALYSVDPDDVPTGQIIELIQPDCVLSRDHHLASFELTSENWGQVVRDYRDASKRDELMITIIVGGNTVFRFSAATFHLPFSLIRKIDIDKKLSWFCYSFWSAWP
jgi:predicted nucleic acid-binding protein